MMDIEELVERLKIHLQSYAAYNNSDLARVLEDAADALSTLLAENEKLRSEAEGMRSNWYKSVEKIQKLRAELEQVKRERDAAIKDLNEFLAMDELCPIQCEWCKWNDTFCDGKTPEWRGIKKEG